MIRVSLIGMPFAEFNLFKNRLKSPRSKPKKQTSLESYRLRRHTNLKSVTESIEAEKVDVLCIDEALESQFAFKLLDYCRDTQPSLPCLFLASPKKSETSISLLEKGITACLDKTSLTAKNWLWTLHHSLLQAKMHQNLLVNSQRWELALKGANDGFWDWDLEKDILFFSSRFISMLGLSQSLAPHPKAWMERIHPEDLDNFKSSLQKYLSGETEQFVNQCRTLHHNGDYRWMLVRGSAIRDPKNKPIRMAGTLTDVSAYKETENLLSQRAFYDELTQLPNRALFLDRLGHALKKAKRRNKYLFAVLFMDLDRFKLVNDSLGHLAGDQLLIQIARRLELCVRPGDTVARLGGDEFTVLLEDIGDINQALRVTERILLSVRDPMTLIGHEVYPTASLGIVVGDAHYTLPEELLRDADTALYEAKRKGRSRFEIFGREMHAEVVEQMRFENDLMRALEKNEFELYYQPIIRLASKEVAGFEALLRWNHPGKGLLLPSDFLSLAEENGLIVSIGEWVLKQACQQVKQWRSQGNEKIWVAVNISASQFNGNLPELITSLTQAGFPVADYLRLEISEKFILEKASKNLQSLKDLGQKLGKLSMDDFGAGYTMLQGLNQVPLHSLKIHESFIWGLQEKGLASITAGIIALAHTLGLEAIAEGVETEQQEKFLRKKNADLAQGFLFGAPLPAQETSDLLTSRLPLPKIKMTR